jgi:hypothetical protein
VKHQTDLGVTAAGRPLWCRDRGRLQQSSGGWNAQAGNRDDAGHNHDRHDHDHDFDDHDEPDHDHPDDDRFYDHRLGPVGSDRNSVVTSAILSGPSDTD